jgi:uncharacterized protein
VTAVDTNILVYALRTDAAQHEQATSALRTLVEGDAPWGIAWHCVHEVISIATHKIYTPPSKMADVLGFLDSLMASPQIELLSETPEYFGRLKEIAGASRITGPRIYDARIAALCLCHGVTELWSADRDFSLFPQLRVRNPLLSK